MALSQMEINIRARVFQKAGIAPQAAAEILAAEGMEAGQAAKICKALAAYLAWARAKEGARPPRRKFFG